MLAVSFLKAADCYPAIVARTTVPYPASAPAPSSGAAPIRRHACASAAEAADPLERNLPVLYTAGMLAGLSPRGSLAPRAPRARVRPVASHTPVPTAPFRPARRSRQSVGFHLDVGTMPVHDR